MFATDYPQAVRDDGEVKAYVDAVRALGPNARAMLEGANAEKLIPDLKKRLRVQAARHGRSMEEEARRILTASLTPGK